MKHGFVLIFSFFTLIHCWAGSRHVIKIESDKSKTQSEVIVEFDNYTNLFTILHDKKKAESFHELKVNELIKLLKEKYVKEEFHEKVIKSVETVQLLDAMTDPSDERLMRASLLMLEDSLAVVDNPPGSDCNDFEYFSNRGKALSANLKFPEDRNGTNPLLDSVMAKKGFFRMGELTGMSMDLNTTNDNIGHGLYRLFGGEADSIEGDDRGSTFGIDGKVSLAFEKGEISLKSFSKGYGRNAPQPRTFMIGDTEYQSSLRYYTDEEGKYYLEFLNYEGVELEVKRFIGESDTYVRITPGMTVKDDQSGLAKEMQDGWHEMTKEQGTIIYHYLDHMERKTSYNLGLELGQELVLSESARGRTSLDYSGGVNLATGDDSDRYFQGDVVIKYERFGLDDKDKLSLPGLEAKLSLGGKYYMDDEKDSAITIDVKKRFQVGSKSYLYLRTGVGYIDDRYSREYGNRELSNNGRLDLQYNYGIGFEIEL